MIVLKNVTKTYHSKNKDKVIALNNVSLNIDKGMVFIVGKSGSGKSTLLNVIGGLDGIDKGEIIVDGQNISSFKNKDYDCYRNTYVGFIFQEFNVLEEYNVLENISLAIELQRKRPNKEEVEELLTKLKIKDLKYRKINELSGGQKQRVAIARALIKSPKIILADEPTGNLDEETSKQIFELLKEISKEKIVIVVSHDKESAIKYADKIIEVKDGVINNEISELENENNYKYVKSKLPIFYSLKMAIKNILHRKTKLVFTIILTTLALSFMGTILNLLIYDKNEIEINTMKENNNYEFSIKNKCFNNGYSSYYLSDNDLIDIKDNIDLIPNLGYIVDTSLNFSFKENKENKSCSQYPSTPSDYIFVELNDKSIIDIIGNYPSNNNEIVIRSYLADYMIKHGVMQEVDYYYPTDYLDILNKYYKLGNNLVKIVGIVKDAKTYYDLREEECNTTLGYRKKEYYFDYVSKGNLIYVTKDFLDNIELVESNDYIVKVNTSFDKANVLNNKIKYISNEIKEISNLENNQVLISLEVLNKLSNNDYQKELNKYLEINNLNRIELNDEFNINYINNHLELLEKDIYLIEYSKYESKSHKLEIVGITDNTYISSSLANDLNKMTKYLEGIYYKNSDINKLKQIFNKYGYINDEYEGCKKAIETSYSSTADYIYNIFDNVSKYIIIFASIITGFTIILIMNFIAITISYSKKQIGILRSLGSRESDVSQIFFFESFIVGLVSWFLSIFGYIYCSSLINNALFNSYPFTLNGITIHYEVIFLQLLIIILVTIIATSISINRLSKIKPIDAILNSKIE